MTQEKDKIWVPKKDFRTRFAERDLLISKNEYERIREEYLQALRKRKEQEDKEQKERERLESIEKAKKAKQTKLAEDTLKRSEPIAQVLPNNKLINRKIESKKANASEEKKELYIDINIPSITGLVDDYTKPVVYNSTSKMFEIVNDPEETVSYARDAILNRPSPSGISEYEDRYLRATDPIQRLKDVRDRYNIPEDPYDARERAVKKGTFWEETVNNLFSPSPSASSIATYQPYNKRLLSNTKNREYIDDVISTYAIGKNNAEFDAYVDAGIRLGEKKQYANIIEQYGNNINTYIQLQNRYNEVIEDANISDEDKRKLLVLMNNILALNEKLRPLVEQAVTYEYSTSSFMNAAKGLWNFFESGFNYFDNLIGNPFNTIGRALGINKLEESVAPKTIGSYGKELLDWFDSAKLMPGHWINPTKLDSFSELKNNILTSNKEFLNATDRVIKEDKEYALKNKQEALDWEEWHTPSREFKAKEKASQANYLTRWDTYKYGMWGTLGSSAAFNGILMLSAGLNYLGMGLLMAPNPLAKAAGAVSTAAGATLGILSGIGENRAEITNNYIAGLRQSLLREGRLDKFLKDGRELLSKKGIKIRDDEDVFRHFILKDYKVNDPVIQELALRHMFGANNAFQNDMMAVSADVAFNAGLNIFGATGQVAELLKLVPKGGSNVLLSKFLANGAVLNISKALKPTMLSSAVSPLAAIPYNIAVKPLVSGVKSALKPMVKEAAKYMGRAASWAKIAPQSIYNTATVGLKTLDFLGKTSARGFSEAIEEGKQYEYGKMFSEGKFAGSSNSIFKTLIDDLSTGLYTGLSFIGHLFFGIESDKDLMTNMRGGFLGGILNHGTVITAAQNTINAVGQLGAGDVIFNNVMAEKLRQRSDVVNGEQFAKYTSRVGYAQMKEAFLRIKAIHNAITADASEKVGLSDEELERQEKQYKRIAALYNDNLVKERAKKLGIKYGSDDYRKLVSWINVADQILVENVTQFNEMVELAKQILEKDGLTLDASDIFKQAQMYAEQVGSEEFKSLVDTAKAFAEWIQPLNNQVAGQYAALNQLIHELLLREEFLTEAEKRNLNHYIAQRLELDEKVEDLKNRIGGVENIKFLNNVPLDILDKYTSIYRSLFLASAQLETSSVVLNNLYGKNNSTDLANDYVAELLEFINQRIDKINKERTHAIKTSKKNPADQAAIDFLNLYKKSLDDDINLMAELANRFDEQSYDSTNRLDGTVENTVEETTPTETSPEENNLEGGAIVPFDLVKLEYTEEVTSVVEQREQEALPEHALLLELPGRVEEPIDAYPADVLKLLENQKLPFNIGDIVISPDEPDKELTVGEVRYNPATNQYLLEAFDKDGNRIPIFGELYKALPAPVHYENILKGEDPFATIKFKKDSPFYKIYSDAVNKSFPKIIDDSYRDYIVGRFEDAPLYNAVEPDILSRVIEDYVSTDMMTTDSLVEWNPLHGAIFHTKDDAYTFAPFYRSIAPQIYEDFYPTKQEKLSIVSLLIQLRDENNISKIKEILRDNNINENYIHVLDSSAALYSIANQIISAKTGRSNEWLSKHAFYTDANNTVKSGILSVVNKGDVVLTNVNLNTKGSNVAIDIMTVDPLGRTSMYILAFHKNPIDEKSIDELGPKQSHTIRQSYNELANFIYNSLLPHQQQGLKGIYILPVSDTVLTPIPLTINSSINNFSSNYTEFAAKAYESEIDQAIANYNEHLNRPQKPDKQEDGTVEDTIKNIQEQLVLLEGVIEDVKSGKFSFGGKIRSDAKIYLELMRSVLTKHRNFLKKQNGNEDSIDKIQHLYSQIIDILGKYRSTFEPSEWDYSGDIVKTNRPIIPDTHPLLDRSTSGKPVIYSSDFITNGRCEIVYGQLNQHGEVTKLSKYSTEPGVGIYAIFTYDRIKYPPVMIQPSHYKNGVLLYTKEGFLFVNDIIDLQNKESGAIVVDAKRMIPSCLFNNPPTNVLDIKALGFTEDDLWAMRGDSDSVGLVNKMGHALHIDKSEDKSILWKFNEAQSGSVFLFYTLNFNEYDDGMQLPIRLIPNKLKKSDVDVIINILIENALSVQSGQGETLSNPYLINESPTPLSNENVLKLLLPYDSNPTEKSLFWISPNGLINFKRHANEAPIPPIDILTLRGQDDLRRLLSNGYEVAQNRGVLKANLLDSDFALSSLKTWIEQNGPLVISDNIQFDKTDVTKNGTGFSGIGWSLRHGRLLSNLSSIYEPSISISNPTIDDGLAHHHVEQSSTQTELPTRERPKIRSQRSLGIDFEQGVEFYAVKEVPEQQEFSEEEVLEDIRNILGDVAVKFTDGIICILNNGLKALGATLKNIIQISKLATEGVRFHESFHWIVELLLNEEEREKLYKSFTKLHPDIDSTNPRNISEGLAEDFKDYALKRKHSSKYKKFWDRIINFAKCLFNADRRALYKMYRNAYNGKYKNIKPSKENVERFERLFKITDNYAALYHTVYSPVTGEFITLQNVPSDVAYRTAIDTIIDNVMSAYGVNIFATNLLGIKLDLESIKKLSGENGFYTDLIGDNNPDDINKIFRDIFDNWDNVVYDIIASFKRFGIHFKYNRTKNTIETYKTPLSEEEQNALDSAAAGEVQSADIGQYTLQDYQISKLKKMQDRAKFFFATIPATRFVTEDDGMAEYVPEKNVYGEEVDIYGRVVLVDPETKMKFVEREDGSIILEKDIQQNMVRATIEDVNYLGYYYYAPMAETIKIALNRCYNVRSLPLLLHTFREVAKEFAQFVPIANKFEQLLESMHARDKHGNYITTDGNRYKRLSNGLYQRVISDIEKHMSYDNESNELFTKDELDFVINENNQAMVVSIFNSISGTKHNFINVTSTRPAPSSIIYQVADTDGGFKARRYLQAWHSSFLSDYNKVTPVEVINKGEKIVRYKALNENLFKNVADGIRAFVNAYTDRKSTEYKTGQVVVNRKKINIWKQPEKVKQEYINLLNQIGILITANLFDTLLFHLYGKTDKNAVMRYFQQDGEDFGLTKGVSLFKLVLSIEQGVTKGGYLSDTVQSGSLYNNTGAIILLADAVYMYKQQKSDLMLRAPGKNKYYQIANRNAQDEFTLDLNDKDSQFLRDLYSNAYHRGSIYIKSLIDGKIMLKTSVHAGYKSDNKDDFGSDFLSITNPEDLVSKIKLLIDGYIIPPTLSSKKTYQPIQIIDTKTLRPVPLPGMQFVINSTNTQTSEGSAEVYAARNVPMLFPKTIDQTFSVTDFNGLQFVLPTAVLDCIINYAFSEYNQFVENLKTRRNLPDSEKVANFDIPTYGARNPGALRFSRFYEIWIRDDKGLPKRINFNDDSREPEKNLEDAETYFFGNNVSQDQRRAIVQELMNRKLFDNLDYFEKMGVIRLRKNWRTFPKYLRYEPVALDTNCINAISKEYTQLGLIYGIEAQRSIATCAFVMDVIAKNQIVMEEYQRLFVGHPGLFASKFDEHGVLIDDTFDISKRLGGHISSGENQCPLDDVPSVYNVGELKDYKTVSPQKQQLLEWFNESESRFTLWANTQKTINIQYQNIKGIAVSILNDAFSKTRKKLSASDVINLLQELLNELPEKLHDECENLIQLCREIGLNEAVSRVSITCDTMRDDELKEEYVRQAALTVDQVYNELGSLAPGVRARVAAYSKNFDNINVTDGGSIVSPDMVRYMLKSIGLFTGNVAKAWRMLLSDSKQDPLSNAENYKLIMDSLFGTQKYTAVGYRMNNGTPIFYQLKTALFPMFKLVAKGHTYDLLVKMEEQNVQMVPFVSSIKYGSQGSQSFPSTKEELDKFLFNMYQCLMKYLRKQLNTNPKESDLMTVGSQAKKIALTILDTSKNDYIVRGKPGVTESGQQIKDRIFNAERKLSNYGRRLFVSRFASVDEKSKYLIENLSERDADSNMLQGLSLVPSDPEDPNSPKKMRAKLEALSNSEWILSIITSLANKNIVDVNLPGSAFIQRSVFTMEDNSILSDEEVGIPPLFISNDWSNMDAVVSIDFFYQQFSFLEDMSFDEAREWLIRNKIIGPNATAETVAYRIPTQANSSIHALRFVDVISTVRDTIILPKEFTAITGSDFDIDKLFISTKFYKVSEDRQTVDMNWSESENPLEYYGNILLESYLQLLSQPKSLYANQLIRSIDYDTTIPGQVVKKLRARHSNKITVYDALQLYRQCLIKASNRTGGIGVGPYALNNNNEIMSRLFGVESQNVGILKALDISRLYDQADAEGNSIMASLGAFISGHVDIEKDNWVSILNINEYTYDIHIYLARAGLGLRALWFCAQPIMLKLADVYIQAGGNLYNTKGRSLWLMRNEAIRQFEKVYVLLSSGNSTDKTRSEILDCVKDILNFGDERKSESNKTLSRAKRVEQVIYTIQQIFGVNPQNPSEKIDTFTLYDGSENGRVVEGTILEDIALNHFETTDIFDDTPMYIIKTISEDGKPQNKVISVRDVLFYVYLTNVLLDGVVNDMKSLVLYSKIETKKLGKNKAELYVYKNKFNRFFMEGNTNIMLPDTVKRMVIESSIGVKMDNFYEAVDYALGEELLEYSIAYELFINLFLRYSGAYLSVDTVKSIIDGLKAYQKYEYIRDYAAVNDIDIPSLFLGNDSIYNSLVRIKSIILNYPQVYSKYTDGNGNITNILLESLDVAYIPKYVRDGDYGKTLPKFVLFSFDHEDDSVLNNDLEAGWKQMLEDQDHPDIQEFAKRLIVYAFITSGDTNRTGSFFKYVPFSWREEDSGKGLNLSYTKYVESLLLDANRDLIDEHDRYWISLDREFENEEVFDKILLNNWFDDNLVPTIQETTTDDSGDIVSNYYSYNIKSTGEPILIALVLNKKEVDGSIIFLDASKGSRSEIIKIHDRNAHSYTNPMDFKLFKFVRMGTIFDKDGKDISFPIYKRVEGIGGRMYGHDIMWYDEVFGFEWNKNVPHYKSLQDELVNEMGHVIKSQLAQLVDREMKQVETKELSILQLRKEIAAYHKHIPIIGSYEDGLKIDFTNTIIGRMARMMANYSFITPKDKFGSHNDSLYKFKKPGLNSEEKPVEKSENKKIDIDSRNGDEYSKLTNPASRSIKLSQHLLSSLSTIVGNKIIESIGKVITEFNSVELAFLLIKFELMKEYIKSRAEQELGLTRLQLSSSKDQSAIAVRGIISNIQDKQRRIAESPGISAPGISHELIPTFKSYTIDFFPERWNEGGPDNVENSTAYKVMRAIIFDSFILNPTVTKLLLSTEDSELTHVRGGLYWKEGFPKALMSVRNEIKETYNKLTEVENKGLSLLGGDLFAYEEYTLSVQFGKDGKSLDTVTPFFTEEEINGIKQAIPNMNLRGNKGHLIVTSASRHTDPVFYATLIINTLRENASKPFTDPTRINIIELWSKHDGIPMLNILEACKKYRVAPMVSFSITGLGNTSIEPGVMKADDLLDNIEKLINQGILDPRTTTIRVDPILVGVSKISDLRNIIERGANMGIKKFVTSPVQSYDTSIDLHTGKPRTVVPFINTALQQGLGQDVEWSDAIMPDGTYNWMKYYGLHPNQLLNPGKYRFVPMLKYLKPYIDMMQQMMNKYDIEIYSCAIPIQGLKPSACCDPAIIEAITTLKVDPMMEEKTRLGCKCYGVHYDMFAYNDACKSSCSYCYAGQMLTPAFDYYNADGTLKDFSYAKVNDYVPKESGPKEVFIKDTKYVYNNGTVVDANGDQVDAPTRSRVMWKLAMDLGQASYVKLDGIYYVVNNDGRIFNWNTAKMLVFDKHSDLKKQILRLADSSLYGKQKVSTIFNAKELKELGESRKKLCK